MTDPRAFDVAVVGAGVAGMACALGLAQTGIRTVLVGPRLSVKLPSKTAPFDARIYAVAPATVEFLQRLSVWNRVDVARTMPVERMRVFGDRGDALTFDAYGGAVERLATIVEESELVRVLDAACDFSPGVVRIESPFAAIRMRDGSASVELADATTLQAQLVVGADGASSAVRAAGGCSASVTEYQQSGLVANFRCERPHLATAFQWFTDEGVVALLPLPSDHVSLVWSAPTVLADELAHMAPEALAARVTQRTGQALGALSPAGPAAAFPLRMMIVERLVGPRVALVGDAAHLVHPLAGQGLNLGLQDVAALLEVIGAREAFRDIGDLVLLRRYERNRAAPIATMRAATDGLARLFGIDDPLARFIRNTGMAAVNRLAPIKRLLIRRALG
jgi:ubiquinone biosynthesis UbiH/UbiF/VisC/COQ6 family hydroxylase